MLYLASDHTSFELKQQLLLKIQKQKWEVVDLTPKLKEGDDYPDVAELLVNKLKHEPHSLGIAFCGTGQGICMGLNRFPWIRAGLTERAEVIKLLREHDHANVICFGGWFITPTKAWTLLKIFLESKPSKEERHVRRVGKLGKLGTSEGVKTNERMKQ
jgi:ribose 5-phosphate isomerase B